MELLSIALLALVVHHASGQINFPIDSVPGGPGSCDDPLGPVNGEVRWSRSPDRSEMSATYTCSQGFALSGPATRSCRNGDWSPVEEPICESTTTRPAGCRVPQVPDNGNVVYSQLDGRPYRARYECYRADCTLNGPSTRNCVNGQWVPAQNPTCSCPLTPPGNVLPSNPCEPNPCLNQGSCVASSLIVSASRFTCICQNGYSGTLCQVSPNVPPPADSCRTNPCQNGGRCSTTSTGYSCSCPRPYLGRNCERFVDPCSGNQCQNRATCAQSLSTQRGYRCNCAPFYTGDLCDQRIFGNPCLVSLCENRATCSENRARSIGYECRCPPGFTGQFCGSTARVDPCQASFCRNGATCIESRSNILGYGCQCASGYTGQFCDQRRVDPCQASVCRNGATCIESRSNILGYGCQCASGYTGQFCDQRIPTQPSPSVTITPSSLRVASGRTEVVTCSSEGNRVVNSIRWSRQDGRPFASNVLALGAGRLIFFRSTSSASGTYICTIRFSDGSQSTSSLTVRISGGGGTPPSACSSNPCRNGGTCRSGDQFYSCSCTQQYRGRNCEQVIPPPPPCDSGPCQNGGTCFNNNGRFFCQCPPSYQQPDCRRPAPTVPQVGPSPLQVAVSPSRAVRQRTNDTALYCQAENLPAGYAVTSTSWTRTNNQGLPFGRSQQYTSNTYLYISNHQESDSGDYRCTVAATNALGQTVSGSATATITVTNIGIRINPSSAFRKVGESVTLDCTVEGVRETPTWRRQNSSRSYPSGRYLSLRNLRESDSDQYYCQVSSGLRATATVSVGLSEDRSMCIATDGRSMAPGEYRYVNASQVLREAQVSPAADFIFLVDESGSMIQEHAWLEQISAGLDSTLQKEGIGTSIPNQFCMIGFAHPPFDTGRVIKMPSGATMGNAMEFDEARKQLAIDGRTEDMYAAMNLGFQECELRPGMACQVIGITDEGRSPLVSDTFQTMLSKLQSRNCVLNVGVNEKMLAETPEGSQTALGVSSRNDSAIEQPGGTFKLIRGKGRAQAISGHGNTDEMYVQLAFKTGGAAWDLNELRKGGNTAKSFTEAFIDIKVREISSQVCQLCECDSGPLPFCTRGCLGEPPLVDADGPKDVPAGGDVELICIPAGGSPVPDLEFKPSGGQGSLPPNSVVTQDGDSIILRVSNVQEKFCVDCVGTNLEGEHTDQHCVDVLTEPPNVELTGSNRGQPVPHGDPVQLTCVPLSGLPLPTLEISASTGYQLPPGTTVVQQGNNTVVSIPGLTQDVCIDCTGTNRAGANTDQECLRVASEPPAVDLSGTNNGRPVQYGGPVTLTCVPLSGIPNPTLEVVPSSRHQLPAGTRTNRIGNNVVVTIPRLTERVCFDCIGTNAVGRNVDQECLEILPENPIVDLTGSNNGRPVPYGQPVTLRCVPIAGRPEPTLRISPASGQLLPSGTTYSKVGSVATANIPRLTENVCFDCVGTNAAGTHSDQVCLTVLAEPPVVDLTSSNRGQPVPAGTQVELVCVAQSGRPDPTLRVTPSSGYNLPSGTRTRTNPDGSVVVTIPRLESDVCFDCVGTNAVGSNTDKECLEILASCPHPRGLDNVVHGGTIRNYTSREGTPVVELPGSAVIIFVIDESGSMRQEHEWLKQLPATMESNLRNKGIGSSAPNQYALVGFGHADRNLPQRERGEVLQGCGPADAVQQKVSTGLYQDGRLEDGYSAISVGLQQLSCLQNINQRRRRGERVACQVILVTDEGRDTLTNWEYNSMRQLLGSNECVLNAAIWERFQGRQSASDAYSLALGVSYNGQAVQPVAPGQDRYRIVPDGRAIDQTGHENTHEKYVKLAFETRGAAWDLEQLRSDLYRASFTNGFIEVKVQEIIRQIIGSCYSCRCDDGVWQCTEIGAVLGEFNCLFPQRSSGGENSEPSAVLRCCTGEPPEGNEVVWFKSGETGQVRKGNELALTRRDEAGTYICLVTGPPFKHSTHTVTALDNDFRVTSENQCSYT